jgi:hypothetical protein
MSFFGPERAPAAVRPARAPAPQDKDAAWRAELGRNAWHLIHSCVYQVSTAEEAETYFRFVCALVELYPCSLCAAHAKEDRCFNARGETLREARERAAGDGRAVQDAVAMWAHAFHNSVNEKTGKAPWPAAQADKKAILRALSERWAPPQTCSAQ